MTGERVAEIASRLEAATPGPWENDGGGDVWQHWSLPEPWKPVVSTAVDCIAYCYDGSAEGVIEEDDANLIANAPADLAYLLAEVARLRAQLDTVRELAGKHEDSPAYVYNLRAALNQGGETNGE